MESQILTGMANAKEIEKTKIINSLNKSMRNKDSMKIVFFKTFALYLTFFVIGLTMPLNGMCMVHLEQLFSTTSETMVLTFFLSSLGWTIGALLCGLCLEKTRNEVAFCVGGVVGGAGVVVAGLSVNVYMYLAFVCVVGACFGFIDTGSQVYCVGVWEGRRGKMPVLQGLHAVWSLGCSIGPLFIKLFLVELNSANYDVTNYDVTNYNVTNYDVSKYDVTRYDVINYNASRNDVTTYGVTNYDATIYNVTSNDVNSYDVNQTNGAATTYEGLSRVRYAWVSLGVLVMLATLPYFALSFLKVSRNVERSKEDPAEAVKSSWTRLVLLFLVFTFMYLFINLEMLPSNYYPSFAIKQLGWSVQDSANLMTIYYGAHLLGRLIGVPLSHCFPANLMLLSTSILVTVSFLLLLLIHAYPASLWATTAMSGLALSTTFPTVYIYISQLMTLSGAVSSVIMLGACLSNLTTPILVGLLMVRHTPWWLIYALIGFSIAQLLLLAAILLFARKFSHKLK